MNSPAWKYASMPKLNNWQLVLNKLCDLNSPSFYIAIL